MQVNLIGIRTMDFKPKDGEQIKGTQLFVTFPEDGTKGLVAEKLFFRHDAEAQPPEGIKPGDVLDVTYGRKNKILAVTKLDGKKMPPLGN